MKTRTMSYFFSFLLLAAVGCDGSPAATDAGANTDSGPAATDAGHDAGTDAGPSQRERLGQVCSTVCEQIQSCPSLTQCPPNTCTTAMDTVMASGCGDAFEAYAVCQSGRADVCRQDAMCEALYPAFRTCIDAYCQDHSDDTGCALL